MKLKIGNRVLSFLLILALLASCMPGIVLWEVKAAYEENETVTETQSNRTTIYISSSGSEWYSGQSESRPKKDISKIPDYLAKGYNVKLKRGDIWYLPTGEFSLKNLSGTEDNPLVIGSYGDTTKPLPTIAFLKKIADSSWTVVDASKNIYKTSVSDLTARGDTDIRVHRLFAQDEAYCHNSNKNYTKLGVEEYCDYGGTLYVRTAGGVPTGVELTPFAGVGHRFYINNVSHLTFENIHIKGSSAVNSLFYIDTPTDHLKFKNLDITHCYYYIMMWDGEDEQIHNKPEISGCFIDSCISEAEGWLASDDPVNSYWNVSAIEGITLRDGVDGAWIHDNHIRQMSHAFIAIESVSKETDTTTTGVRNCVVEDNLLEGGNAQYARAFNICGGYNLSGVQMCRDNTFRRNKCYDMTSSSHLMGENNLVYSNIMSYHHLVYNQDGTLFDGKSAITGAFDTIPWSNHVSIGNMLINNTFYDVGNAITINDSADSGVIHDNIYANNLIVNWSNDAPLYPGAFYDDTIALNYVMNNAVYSATGMQDHFVVDNQHFTAQEANQLVGYSGNVSGDPKFQNADVTLTGKNVRQDFTLSSASPFRYAGLPLNAEVYAAFPAWQRLLKEYTDVNGDPFLPNAPSIGAITYDADPPETITITDIKTNVKPVGVVVDYPNYVGEKWQEALGASNVIVGTSDGGTATVAVDWDYTPLGDVTKCGKYVIKGKLVSEFYGNPDSLTLERVIVVQKKVNLFVNGGFEAVSGGQPTGWYMRGAGGSTYGYSTLYPLSGKYAAQPRGTDATATSRNCYNNTGNEAPAAVAERVNAFGAGQYYFGVSARKGNSDISVSLSTVLNYKYDGYNVGGGTPVGYANTIGELSTVYQKTSGIVELPEALTSVQTVFTFKKTDTTVTWDAIGVYADEAELIPLCVELPPDMVSVESEIPALSIIENFDNYVSDWQTALKLPTEVAVKTSDGTTASATVTWDYTPLGNLSKVGKYVLTGKLSSDVYLNTNDLTVQQVIYIHSYRNLLINGNFDTVTGKYAPDGWTIRGNGVRYTASNVLGGYAAKVGMFDNPANNNAPSSSQNDSEVGKIVGELGSGDYFFGLWSSATNPVIDVTIQAKLYYKTVTNSNSTNHSANAIILTNAYKQTGAVCTLPDDVNSIWLSIGTQKTDSTVDFGTVGICFDNAELLLIRQKVKGCEHNWADATCTAPKTCTLCGETEGTALGHSHNAVVTAPTCVDGGYTTYTCTACGDKYVADKTPATGEHNYVDGVCSVCGAEEPVTGPETADDLVFLQAPSLSFQDYIGMQLLANGSLANTYDELYVEAIQIDPVKGAVTTKLTGMPYYGAYLLFDQQILSWSMAEQVTLTMYGVKDGVVYVGQSYTESVETLALSMLPKNEGNAKVCRILVDMLNYGAAVQTTFNHNADYLPNTNLGEYANMGTAGDPEMSATNSSSGTGSVSILQTSVSMQSKVEIQLAFMVNISAYTPKATIGAKELTCVVDADTYAAYGMTAIRIAIGAANMRDTVTFALYDTNGNPVTAVQSISVEALVKNLTTSAQGNVILAMMRYGDAVAAFAAG
ncbi:MAG: hypothetical protein E7447_05040, partial [Ruminococcaceae bacterium]|nr:hypothetical protein [Oscillospiraceae bacterium]